MTKILLVLIIVFAAVLAGCSSGPSVQFTPGNALLTQDFTDPNAWESFGSPDGHQFGVVNGAYQARVLPGGYLWGLRECV